MLDFGEVAMDSLVQFFVYGEQQENRWGIHNFQFSPMPKDLQRGQGTAG
jgi:hypothetical protein